MLSALSPFLKIARMCGHSYNMMTHEADKKWNR